MVVVLVSAVWWGGGFLLNKSADIRLAEHPIAVAPEPLIKVSLVINSGAATTSREMELAQGSSVFDVLQKAVSQTGEELLFKNYETGVFVEAIGSQKNGADGKYWLYYVNGKMPAMAADKQIIQAGDVIEFRFEKSPF